MKFLLAVLTLQRSISVRASARGTTACVFHRLLVDQFLDSKFLQSLGTDLLRSGPRPPVGGVRRIRSPFVLQRSIGDGHPVPPRYGAVPTGSRGSPGVWEEKAGPPTSRSTAMPEPD